VRSDGSVSTWQRLRPLLGGRRRAVVTLAVVSILSAFAEAAVLAVVAQVAASLVTGSNTVTASIGPFDVDTSIGNLLLVASALAVVRLVLQIPISVLPARIAADVQAKLRRGLFGAFTRASWAEQSRDLEGHLQEMMTSQVVQAAYGALQVNILITAAFTFVVLIVSALVLNVVAAVLVLVAAVALFAGLKPLAALGHRRSRELSQAQMNFAGGVGEAVRLAEETQVFGVGGAQRERIDVLVGDAQDLFFRTQTVGRLVPNLYQSFIFLIIVLGLAALHLADLGRVASLGAVVLLLVRAGTYGQQLQTAWQQVRQALPFVERLQSAERAYLESAPVSLDRPLDRFDGLSFRGVTYAYQRERPVLTGIDFEVNAGEAIGIIGPSGAGKSTLVQILLQLRNPDSGQYLVNGHPVHQYDRDDWHRQVAYVPQQPRLIHATVAQNIAYFRSVGMPEVERAAQLARIDAEVRSWAKGYDTVVGPRADAVSGGQQQRICLARGLTANPRILVLDEPTSALDPNSEALLQESLRSLAGEVTLFIVAHRMTTLDICDRVMVVRDGRIEAFDNASTLAGKSSYYRSASAVATGSAGL
jgi:ABC-type multidrug transport system fused ATPase/permease subunit